MSRKSRLRRKMEAQKRREQAALQASLKEQSQETIGSLVRGICLSQASNVFQPATELPTAESIEIWPVDWPTCPETCDINEWKRALENRDFYLAQQKADNNAKPWFQYPRSPFQYSEFVYITPPMAQELLQYNPINRKVNVRHVDGLRRDIINHRWLQTHESIAINKLGNMHDGQHRAHAIIKADSGWPLYITFGVPPEALYVTDSGDKRPVNEKLMFLFPELKASHKAAAVARNMMWGLSNRNIRYTESEIGNFMHKHNKVINWVVNNMRPYRSELMAVVGKSLLWWGEETISPFVERLRGVQFTGEGDPAKALYLWLQNAKAQGRRTAYVSPLIFYKKTLSAIHAHAMGREAKRIIIKEQDVFEWLPGWEVPDAPCGGNVFTEGELDEDLAQAQ